jgi:hypothetical protein
MLVLHVSFAHLAAAFVDRDVPLASPVRRAGLAVTAGVVVLGLVGVAPGLLRAVPRSALPADLAEDDRMESVVDPWQPLGEAIEYGAVVATPDSLSDRVAAFGGRLLVPPDKALSLSPEELPERIDARDEILADPTSSEAEAARRRYGATYAVFPERPGFDGRAGRVVLETPDYVVFALG